MEAELSSLGASLKVPSVQELVKGPLTAVPPRYVRPKQEIAASSPQSVPVIDFQRLLSEESMEAELHKLDSGCKEWGFFQVCSCVSFACKILTPALKRVFLLIKYDR